MYVHAKFHQTECSTTAVHELSCTQTFLSYHAMVKNPKIRFCDLDVSSMTLKFNRILLVVRIHVPAKIHKAVCSGS